MSKRERNLAIIVGLLVVVVALNWGYGKYRDALQSRSSRITALQEERSRLEEGRLRGAYADRQMGQYLSRSLSGDPEQAKSDYLGWLLRWVDEHELANPTVDPGQTFATGEVYRRLTFNLRGRTDLPKLIGMLHSFYATDYLHRMKSLDIERMKDGGLTVRMAIDALSLNAAAADREPPGTDSWRIESSLASYRNAILNRNFFQPPNQVPKYEGGPELEAIVGQSTQIPLKFTDPEGHELRYTLDGEIPEFVELDSEDGVLKLSPESTGEYQFAVRAIDGGYPSRSADQPLVLKVNPPPPEEEPQPSFDDARLAFLTGMTEGREGWSAWINVRTTGETLILGIGDTLEVGSVKAKVVEAAPKVATLEVDGRRFDLPVGQSLADAAEKELER